MTPEKANKTPIDAAAFDLLRDVVTCLRNGSKYGDTRDPITACKEAILTARREAYERAARVAEDFDDCCDTKACGVPNRIAERIRRLSSKGE